MMLLAWIGSIAFIISAIPQTIKVYKEKHAKGLSWAFIFLWWLGDVTMTAYSMSIFNVPMVANYGIQTVLVSIIIYYKHRGG
jgi:uncharacterized protein with PQ loop repeat